METLERVLANHPFLKDLPPAYLSLLVGCASQARFRPQEFVFHLGDEANHFYLIRHGKVALELYSAERGPITIQTLGPGDVLGWSWLIPPYRWNLDARVVEQTLALCFDAACLRGKCEADHDLGYELYKRFTPIMVQRLQATRLQVLDVHRVYA